MILRKLKRQDADRTRPMWEEIFHEDGPAFVDYYYEVKTAENEIYVIESEGEIRAMLHSNPYTLRVERSEADSNYIVAVATDSGYRSRGYMTELLRKSIRDMYMKKMPFTFLMPAAEAIYYPHHFRFVYDQQKWNVSAKSGEKLAVENLVSRKEGQNTVIRCASLGDCKKIAQFVESLLDGKMQVYARRDRSYYEKLLLEQESQEGGILLAEQDDEIKGVLLYDKENGFSVREPLFLPGYEQIFEEGGLVLQEAEKKPMIMARILHLESLLEAMNCKEETEFYFELVDPVIRENNKIYMVRGNEERIMVRTKPIIKGKYNGIQRISVGALTSILFGYKSLEKIEEEEQEEFSVEFKEAIRKINPLQKVFLNEIV